MIYDFCILGLAVTRLTILVVSDVGPFSVMSRIRALNPRMLACPSCMSIWTGLAAWLGYTFFPEETLWAGHVLALSQVARFFIMGPLRPSFERSPLGTQFPMPPRAVRRDDLPSNQEAKSALPG